MPRKLEDEAEARRRQFPVRVTDDERQLFDAGARAAGFVSTAEWIRVTCRREAKRVLRREGQ